MKKWLLMLLYIFLKRAVNLKFCPTFAARTITAQKMIVLLYKSHFKTYKIYYYG